MKVAESLEAVHTHTHTHTISTKLCIYLLCLQCNGGICLLDRAVFSKISFIKHVKKIKIYRDRLRAKVKKLLQNSLSFLHVWRW